MYTDGLLHGELDMTFSEAFTFSNPRKVPLGWDKEESNEKHAF